MRCRYHPKRVVLSTSVEGPAIHGIWNVCSRYWRWSTWRTKLSMINTFGGTRRPDCDQATMPIAKMSLLLLAALPWTNSWVGCEESHWKLWILLQRTDERETNETEITNRDFIGSKQRYTRQLSVWNDASLSPSAGSSLAVDLRPVIFDGKH